jgi:hypothetical protein
MKRWTLLALIGVVSTSAACAAILGIEDGILDTSLQSEAGVVICESDSGLQVDTSQVFVSAGSDADDSVCGDDQSPCKSITAGIAALAKTRGAHLIYVSDGTYNESIRFPNLAAFPNGLEIQGGWHTRGTNPSRQWVQVCAGSLTDPTQIANIVGVENVTVHAEDIGGSATLTNLLIKSRAPKPGESVFGIFASNSTRLTLNQVIVALGNGGDGAGGITGNEAGVAPVTCPPADGADGSAGEPGGGAPATTFGLTGASTGVATSGSPGTAGHNGEPGLDGGCIACVSCPVGSILSSCGAAAGSSCGARGIPGCGGLAGEPGGPGQSGGSTIGIFAWGGAVIVNGGSIQSGVGGKGGSGGSGGAGGAGSPGESGADGGACPTTCTSAAVCLGNGNIGEGIGGGRGGTGGLGGPGGVGGGGAGGDSYAIYSGIDASVLVDGGATVKAGLGGDQGGNGAAAGFSKDRFP